MGQVVRDFSPPDRIEEFFADSVEARLFDGLIKGPLVW